MPTPSAAVVVHFVCYFDCPLIHCSENPKCVDSLSSFYDAFVHCMSILHVYLRIRPEIRNKGDGPRPERAAAGRTPQLLA